jgi:hypothetical protein
MKKTPFQLPVPLFSNLLFAKDRSQVSKLINEDVECLHEGDEYGGVFKLCPVFHLHQTMTKPLVHC